MPHFYVFVITMKAAFAKRQAIKKYDDQVGENTVMPYNEWFSQLFNEHYALLYRVGAVFLGTSTAHATLIEDQIQETFMLAWRNEDKVKAHVNPTGWLVETFRRLLMAQCRKTSRERKRQLFSLDDEAQWNTPDLSATPIEEIVWNAEQLALLRRLLGEADAELFVQYCIQGATAKELALSHQMSESNIRVRISRLKKKLLTNRELFLCVAGLFAWMLHRGGSL
ncbi:MAG: sigma-70 family RNA polymerase sigma factor [Clostridia bacterium]